MRRVMAGPLLVAALVVVPAAPALAEDTFSGSCKDIEGVAKFDVPLSNTVSDNVYHFAGTGTCTGKLNGADITDAPIAAQVDGPFTGSCESSESTAPGPGKLVFTKGTPATGDDVTITFTMTFTGIASEVAFTLTGTKSGTATGNATFLTTRTPPDIVLKCGSGGNTELPFDATSDEGTLSSGGSAPAAQTETPAEKPTGGGGGGTGPSQPQQGGTSEPAPSGPPPAGFIEVPAQSWRDVLARGLRVTCHGEGSCAVKLRLTRKTGRKHRLTGAIGSGRAAIPADAYRTDLVAKLTPAARRKLRKLKSVAITVVATVGGRGVTRTVTLRR